jgi:acetoin utilization deacetylase AcuC-like enzyme
VQRGYTINIPWRGGCAHGDTEYISAFRCASDIFTAFADDSCVWAARNIVIPVLTAYNPNMIIVSAGFDAAEGDAIGGYKVTPAGFALMTRMLLDLGTERVVLSLEGGYHINSLSRSAEACLKVLMGQDVPLLPYPFRIISENKVVGVPSPLACAVRLVTWCACIVTGLMCVNGVAAAA